MDGKLQLKLAMLVRIADFLRAYLLGDPPAEALVAKFLEGLERFRVLLARFVDGQVARGAEYRQARELRTRITRGPLRHLRGVVVGLGDTAPGLAAALSQAPYRLAGELFLAMVKSVMVQAEAHRELLRSQGMAEGTLQDLGVLVPAYEAALSQAGAGKRAHTGARHEMDVVMKDLMRLLRQLDAIVRYRFQSQADRIGAWESARNVAWPSLPAVRAARKVPAVPERKEEAAS
jgi:hypothetical protein